MSTRKEGVNMSESRKIDVITHRFAASAAAKRGRREPYKRSPLTEEQRERYRAARQARREQCQAARRAAKATECETFGGPVCAERLLDRDDCERYLECLDRVVREEIAALRGVASQSKRSVATCVGCFRCERNGAAS
jgi:hypothetical protein